MKNSVGLLMSQRPEMLGPLQAEHNHLGRLLCGCEVRRGKSEKDMKYVFLCIKNAFISASLNLGISSRD